MRISSCARIASPAALATSTLGAAGAGAGLAPGLAGLGVPVAPVMLTQRAIFHHSTAQGRTAPEAEPDGKAAQEVAALWTWMRERVNLPTSKTRRIKRGQP